MSDTFCAYPGDRREALIDYVYGELDERRKAAFDDHLTTCGTCRAEVVDLRAARTELAAWAAPEPKAWVSTREFTASPSWSWRTLPAWAQTAAALLFVGVAAGAANLDVRYGAQGLSI